MGILYLSLMNCFGEFRVGLISEAFLIIFPLYQIKFTKKSLIIPTLSYTQNKRNKKR